MSSLARIAALRTILFAVGMGLGLVDAGTTDAQQVNDGQRLTHSPGVQSALDQLPIVTDPRRQTAEMEIGRPAPEPGPARSVQPLRAEDDATHLLYGEIMRETDHLLRR
jgi:hypothetical protein